MEKAANANVKWQKIRANNINDVSIIRHWSPWYWIYTFSNFRFKFNGLYSPYPIIMTRSTAKTSEICTNTHILGIKYRNQKLDYSNPIFRSHSIAQKSNPMRVFFYHKCRWKLFN